MRIGTWVRALRVPFFSGTLIPVIFGTAFAYYWTGLFNAGRFCLVLIGTLFVQAGLNLANDYFDYLSGNDALAKPTPFSGGSRVIQDGLVKPTSILLMSVICLLGVSLIGLYLNHILHGNMILIIGVTGVVLAYFYSAPPLRIGYRSGLAELSCLLGCGPVLILGSYYVQTEVFSLPVLYASLPMGILIALILFINEFADYNADRRVHKNTLVVICGTQKATIIFVVLMILVYLITMMLILTRIFPVGTLIVFVTLPVALFIIRKLVNYHNNIAKLLPANVAVITLHLIFSVISISALLIR